MQGFIEPLDNDRELKTSRANDYFVDLLRRGFFQKVACGTDDRYVIHDLMHDVCLSITKDECFCLENGPSEHKVSLDIRHASVFQKKVFLNEQKELCKYKKLLSLRVGPNSCCITGIETWCNVLTNIRSLSLARCKITNLPENFGNLKHLLFLDISGTYVQALPESFCNLYHLQYLNMMDCSKIKCFPEGLNNLVNSQLFYFPLEKVSLAERFENIVKAIKLYNPTVCLLYEKIEILKDLSKISGSLHISRLEYVPNKEAAQNARLHNKPFINHLGLIWADDRLISAPEGQYIEVLDGLCPHHNLKELEIYGYRCRNLSPSWLKEEDLRNLREVELTRCEVSTICHLPRFITKLVIKDCGRLETLKNWLEPDHLPALKHIEVKCCNNLISLSVDLFGGFVSLEKLIIASCPELRSPKAMVLPPSVKYLELEYCGGPQKLIPSCWKNLTSLETLIIIRCQRLLIIPAEVTRNLKSLSMLNLVCCRMLLSLGGLQFLASVQKVYIRDCPKLEDTRGRDIYEKLPLGLLKAGKRTRKARK